MKTKLITITLVSLVGILMMASTGAVKAEFNTIYVPDDYPTIQAAVDAANSGDTIIVRDGTYTENIDVDKPHLTIKSENGAEKTIVRAENLDDSVFEVTTDHVSITGFTVKGIGDYGIALFWGTKHSNISDNIVSNTTCGIALLNSDYNIIIANSVSDNDLGICLWNSSSNNTIESNIASNNERSGIYLDGSPDNILTNNIMSNNRYNLDIVGSLSHFTQSIDTSNKVNGKPVYYWVNKQDQEIPSDAGYVGIVNSKNIMVKNLILTNNGQGILLVYSTDSIIENIHISNNDLGIHLSGSSNNNIRFNVVSNNNVGIALEYSSNRNNIEYNNVMLSDGGLVLDNSSDNNLYLNNFVDNTNNVWYSFDSTNIWNSPEQITYTYNGNIYTNYLGNYWDDYIGIDTDGDGIGDTPYNIDGDKDNYPLMQPFENYVEGEVPPIPSEFWVEVKEDGECIYSDKNGNLPSEIELEENKVKCLPSGWVLKKELDENGNPIEESLDGKGIRWFNKLIDVTDDTVGWMERGDLNDDKTKQAEWKRRIEIIIFGMNSEISPDFRFSKNKLQYGQENNDIKYLQIILKHKKFFPADVKVVNHFGPTTQEAVKKFQEKYNLDERNGEVDDETVEKLNSILSKNCILDVSRASSIRNEDENLIDNPPQWLKTDFFQGASREERLGFLLAMDLQESGGVSFDNEYVKPDLYDCGRGIMQITTPVFIGWGSGVGCYKNECKRCESEEDRDSCKCYYTNTNQGIGANLKDGLRGLQWHYNQSNCEYYSDECLLVENIGIEFDNYYEDRTIRFTYKCVPESEIESPSCTNDGKKCNSKIKEVAEVHTNEAGEEITDISIPCNKFRIIDSMWRHNGRKVYERGTCKGNDYLWCIAEKLDETSSTTDEIVDIFERTMPNKDDWIKKLKFVSNAPNTMLKILSPANLQVYDSEGRITGLVNGDLITGIPFSSYKEEENMITVPFSYDSYHYKIAGTETGNYGFEAIFIENGNIATFTATEIPISTSTIHQYTIDWDALSQGKKGVTLQIDADGDGVFEKTVTADNNLTYDEFILQTETIIDFDPDTLNLEDKGKSVTTYIELPERYEINQKR